VKSLSKQIITAIWISLLPVGAFYLISSGNLISNYFALSPGSINHLPGILLMPFVHADTGHLWGNTMQLFLGLLLILLHFRYMSAYIIGLQWLGAGVILFLIGEKGTMHIGSSGVIYGLFSFLIVAGFMAGNRRLRLLSFMLLMYYGGMIWGVFPWQQKVSWEGHLSGTVTGIITAVLMRKGYRPFTMDMRPSWLNDTDTREDPYDRFDRRV